MTNKSTNKPVRWYSKSGKFIAMVNADGTGGFSVTVTRRGVEDFTYGWPCSRNMRGPIHFEFESTDDLIDLHGTAQDGYDLLALLQDAAEFGTKAREKQRQKYNRAQGQ